MSSITTTTVPIPIPNPEAEADIWQINPKRFQDANAHSDRGELCSVVILKSKGGANNSSFVTTSATDPSSPYHLGTYHRMLRLRIIDHPFIPSCRQLSPTSAQRVPEFMVKSLGSGNAYVS